VELEHRAWRWVGHTLWRPEGSIAKRALEWNPPGRRKWGTFSSNVKKTVNVN